MTPLLALTATFALASPLPPEVTAGLTPYGIEVVAAGTTVPVPASQAFRTARKHVGLWARPYTAGWVRLGRMSANLVRVVHSESLLSEGQVVWLVVIRDATIPVLGPRGGTYVGSIGVFVGSDKARFLEAVTL
jgi:hypothetical protein